MENLILQACYTEYQEDAYRHGCAGNTSVLLCFYNYSKLDLESVYVREKRAKEKGGED